VSLVREIAFLAQTTGEEEMKLYFDEDMLMRKGMLDLISWMRRAAMIEVTVLQ
jgi:hypothetical protein